MVESKLVQGGEVRVVKLVSKNSLLKAFLKDIFIPRGRETVKEVSITVQPSS